MTNLKSHFDKLTDADIQQLEDRAAQYRAQIEAQGFEIHIAKATNGLFAGVLVKDPQVGRHGFLEEDGSISWIQGGIQIGKVGSAVSQRRKTNVGDK